jgi:hypothetical protein
MKTGKSPSPNIPKNARRVQLVRDELPGWSNPGDSQQSVPMPEPYPKSFYPKSYVND